MIRDSFIKTLERQVIAIFFLHRAPEIWPLQLRQAVKMKKIRFQRYSISWNASCRNNIRPWHWILANWIFWGWKHPQNCCRLLSCRELAVLVIHYALFDGDKRRICHFTFIHTVHVIRYDIKAQEDTKGVFFLKFNSSSQQTKYLNTRKYRYCQGIRKEIATSQIAREL